MVETKYSAAEIHAQSMLWRMQGKTIGLVPTMGALHAGHLSLIREAVKICDKVIISIFVNPMQFRAGEDFDAYPRTLDEDREKIAALGFEDMLVVYTPEASEIYPRGFATSVSVKGLTEVLCGASRPGHFDGVATIVTKLLVQTSPGYAFFGEKDYQQLLVVRRLAKDLNIQCEIVGCPIVREMDGLAMSSRNAYLSSQERSIAPILYQTLNDVAEPIRSGIHVATALEAGKDALAIAGFDPIDYFDYRTSTTLEKLDRYEPGGRLLAAAHLCGTRLIDNCEV